MEINYSLECFNSKADIYGNRYWAFCFTELATGKSVVGRFGGGESNIYAVLCYWNNPNRWDRSIRFQRIQDMPIRRFNVMVKDYPYAGSQPEELAKFIRRGLSTE